MKELRAFGMPWHLAHNYEILKVPGIKWDWLIQHRRQYGTSARGDIVEEFGVNWVTHYEKGKYDFALLHLDQQCLEPSLWQRGKGSLFRELNEIINDIPKILIMHGTPYYPEKFPALNEFGEECDGLSEELIDLFKRESKGCYVITNSIEASKQWGRGTPIWHGLDPDEWKDHPKEPRVVTMIGPAGLDKYYDRTFLAAVKEALLEEGIHHCHITSDVMFKGFKEYRDFLGRSLIYFNPTKESPMPRARTEAMLSGCCVLTTPHQDAHSFIEHGKNGFIVKRNPAHVVEIVKQLINNYDKAIKIGQEGKKTALKVFSQERYQNEWRGFVEKAIEDFKSKQ